MVDQVPELNPLDLKRMSFFEPEPSDAAMHTFQKYVDVKWPLRVYAIEPVIAQQNVADAFSRRKFSAIDLVGSTYSGPIKRTYGNCSCSGRRPMTRPPLARRTPRSGRLQRLRQSTASAGSFIPGFRPAANGAGSSPTSRSWQPAAFPTPPAATRASSPASGKCTWRLRRNAQFRTQDRVYLGGKLVPGRAKSATATKSDLEESGRTGRKAGSWPRKP